MTLDEKAEDDIARAFEICSREIPPPDPTPATPAANTNAVPLTRPTLSRALPHLARGSGRDGCG